MSLESLILGVVAFCGIVVGSMVLARFMFRAHEHPD
jgi:hypothetical protein